MHSVFYLFLFQRRKKLVKKLNCLNTIYSAQNLDWIVMILWFNHKFNNLGDFPFPWLIFFPSSLLFILLKCPCFIYFYWLIWWNYSVFCFWFFAFINLYYVSLRFFVLTAPTYSLWWFFFNGDWKEVIFPSAFGAGKFCGLEINWPLKIYKNLAEQIIGLVQFWFYYVFAFNSISLLY